MCTRPMPCCVIEAGLVFFAAGAGSGSFLSVNYRLASFSIAKRKHSRTSRRLLPQLDHGVELS